MSSSSDPNVVELWLMQRLGQELAMVIIDTTRERATASMVGVVRLVEPGVYEIGDNRVDVRDADHARVAIEIEGDTLRITADDTAQLVIGPASTGAHEWAPS